jgi:TonB family protein
LQATIGDCNTSRPGMFDLTGKARVEEVKTRSRGGNTNLGNQASVDAEATPEGRYAKTIHEKVGLVWNRKMATIRGLTGVGTVEVEFDIDAEGRISNVQLVDPGKANPILEDVCLSAIIAAKLPPPPQELIDELRDPITGGRMRRRFTFHRL